MVDASDHYIIVIVAYNTYNYRKISNNSRKEFTGMVYVISKSGKQLMPCASVVARLLLKSGKAKCIRRTPFTIKLLYETTEYTQPLTHGIDTGSSKIGSAVATEEG